MESPDSIVDPTHAKTAEAVAEDVITPDAAASRVSEDVIDLTTPSVEAATEDAVIDLSTTDETVVVSDESGADVIDLTTTEDAPTSAPATDASADGPSVDALEEQLGSLQGAMDKLQAGDLDGAERTIEALEQQIASLRS